jgi:uncharacterized delta-60 repeat protein
MLNDNGSVATSFQPRPNAPVRTLLALPDGRVLAGGAFTSIGGAARAHLVRLNADGGLDAAYNPVVPQAVSALALQPDGRVLVGHATGVLRLNANGSADASFSATLNGPVTGLAVQPDGRILALQGRTLVRLTVAGASAGAALATGDLRAFTLLADGGIVVAGTGAITTASGASRANLCPAELRWRSGARLQSGAGRRGLRPRGASGRPPDGGGPFPADRRREPAGPRPAL